MEEFQEIFLSGGVIEFKKAPEGGVSIGFRGATVHQWSLFQVCVSYEGTVLDTVPFGGIERLVPYPQPSLLVFVLSDQQNMFGRRCPQCKSYFRTDSCPGDRFCPYCGHHGRSIDFLTENQLKYISAFCESFLAAHDGDEDVILNLHEALPANRPQWLYTEEHQQNWYACSGCKTKMDILGEYALCPHCGRPNFSEVFGKKLSELETQFTEANKQLRDRHDREIEWEKLTRCVSDFESMANHVRRFLLRFPATPQRKSALHSLSFQKIQYSAERISEWFGFDILNRVPEDDRRFLHRMFNRRHLFTHNAGRVDQEYLDNTGDSTVRLHQALRVRSKEIRRLIPLVRECGQRLIQGYESIQ